MTPPAHCLLHDHILLLFLYGIGFTMVAVIASDRVPLAHVSAVGAAKLGTRVCTRASLTMSPGSTVSCL
jgi:hypothetical protein